MSSHFVLILICYTMIIKSRAIILRTFKYSESSLILEAYLESSGLKRFIVSGVRQPRAKIGASLLQLMSLLEIVAYNRPDRDLNRLKEAKPAYVYQNLPFSVPKGAIGLFMTEIAQKTLRASEQNERLFAFLFHTFRFLDQTTQPIANIHLYFLLQLSGFLGFQPGGDYSEEESVFDLQEGIFVPHFANPAYTIRPPLSALLYQLLLTDLEHCHTVKMTRDERNALLNHLIDFYRLHVESLHEVNAHEVLREVLG